MIDRNVGQVLDLLRQLGLEDKTIVFFCSDNGAANRFDGSLNSSGRLRGQKRDMYEGGIRVPMIVRWPGKIEAGRVSKLPWTFQDVMPTFAELVGAKIDHPIDGLSIVLTLLGEDIVGRKQAMHEYLYWEYSYVNWKTRKMNPVPSIQAVRLGDWKAVRPAESAPLEIYDLRVDPSERNDLAAEKPDLVRRFQQII